MPKYNTVLFGFVVAVREQEEQRQEAQVCFARKMLNDLGPAFVLWAALE